MHNYYWHGLMTGVLLLIAIDRAFGGQWIDFGLGLTSVLVITLVMITTRSPARSVTGQVTQGSKK
ncbi:hypothetical protein DFP91_5887 [Pseudorhodoplanes sinuspersici]|nr:hypothetical protein DFP91_5887 [Pseudorhodoplanes sinuspersici]